MLGYLPIGLSLSSLNAARSAGSWRYGATSSLYGTPSSSSSQTGRIERVLCR
jgi:hypothetical protein